MRVSDWSSDVCSSDLWAVLRRKGRYRPAPQGRPCREWRRGRPQPPERRHAQQGDAERQRQDGANGRVEADLRHDGLWPALSSADRPTRTEKRSEEHTTELQSLMSISSAAFCLKK